MKTVEFKCPKCASNIVAAAINRGIPVPCRNCGRSVEVPVTARSATEGENKVAWRIGILAGVAILIFYGYQFAKSEKFDPKSEILIEYQVNGTVNLAAVSYREVGGGVIDLGSVSLPWSKTLKIQEGAYAMISATKTGRDGNVAVRILQNGEEVALEETASPYGVARMMKEVR